MPGRADRFSRQRPLDATLILRRLMSVEGRVIDEQGRPCPKRRSFTPATLVASGSENRCSRAFSTRGLARRQSAGICRASKIPFSRPVGRYLCCLSRIQALGIDQTPPAMTTLPPLLSREEELKLARQVIVPLGMRR